MANLFDTVSVHKVTADDLGANWLYDDPDRHDVHAGIDCLPVGRVDLYFDDRGEAARFFDKGAQLVAMLPDKDSEPTADATDDEPTPVDRFIAEWHHHGAWHVSAADVDMLIAEIERLRSGGDDAPDVHETDGSGFDGSDPFKQIPGGHA